MARLLDEGPVLFPSAMLQVQAMAMELLGSNSNWLAGIVPRTALAVLWLAMHQANVDNMVALTLAEAAGLSGRIGP